MKKEKRKIIQFILKNKTLFFSIYIGTYSYLCINVDFHCIFNTCIFITPVELIILKKNESQSNYKRNWPVIFTVDDAINNGWITWYCGFSALNRIVSIMNRNMLGLRFNPYDKICSFGAFNFLQPPLRIDPNDTEYLASDWYRCGEIMQGNHLALSKLSDALCEFINVYVDKKY